MLHERIDPYEVAIGIIGGSSPPERVFRNCTTGRSSGNRHGSGETAVLELRIRLDDRIGAHAQLLRQAPDRRDAVPGTICPVPDHVPDRVGDVLIQKDVSVGIFSFVPMIPEL